MIARHYSKVHWTLGVLRHLRQFSTPQTFSGRTGFRPPAPAPVTPAVGRTGLCPAVANHHPIDPCFREVELHLGLDLERFLIPLSKWIG